MVVTATMFLIVINCDLWFQMFPNRVVEQHHSTRFSTVQLEGEVRR